MGGIESLPFLFYFERIDPPGPKYRTYPIAQGVWDCFSHNIVRPINKRHHSHKWESELPHDYMILLLLVNAYNLNEVLPYFHSATPELPHYSSKYHYLLGTTKFPNSSRRTSIQTKSRNPVFVGNPPVVALGFL